MNIEYENWINLNYPTPESANKQCKQAVEKMQKWFPELVKVRGHVLTPFEHAHWWLKTPNNEIVDPTKHQFELIMLYEERDESQAEPTGKCYSCGTFCYDNKGFCTKDCENSYLAILHH